MLIETPAYGIALFMAPFPWEVPPSCSKPSILLLQFWEKRQLMSPRKVAEAFCLLSMLIENTQSGQLLVIIS